MVEEEDWGRDDTVVGSDGSDFGTTDELAKPARAWSDVPLEAAKNLPSSAAEFGKNIIQPIIHPVETATALKNLGQGVLQKMGIMSGDDAVANADAVGNFLMDRYGSLEAVQNTLATDPVGIAADVSMLLTGGGMAAARAPGLIGQAGRVASTVGRAVDPLTAAGKVVAPVAKGAGYLASEVIGGLGTHTGGKSLRTAAEAGFEGGESARALRENMRGADPAEAVLEARGALSQIKQERSKAYRAGMEEVGKNRDVLDFGKIDDALADITAVKTFGTQVLHKKTQAIRQEIGQAVQQWKMLDPAEYHTPEGLDALKQQIGDIRDHTQYGTPDRLVADQAYQAIRKTIISAAPKYAHVMKGYEQASTQLRELERGLSLNEKATIDTSLRKLQSVLRNNVNSNYGNREALAAYLATHGAPQLMEKLAGQSLSAVLPRGLGKLQAGINAPLAFFLGSWPAAVAALPMMSPRVMGEIAYYGGRAARGLGEIPLRSTARPAYQAGRAAEESEEGYARGGTPDEAEDERRRNIVMKRGGDVVASNMAWRNAISKRAR